MRAPFRLTDFDRVVLCLTPGPHAIRVQAPLVEVTMLGRSRCSPVLVLTLVVALALAAGGPAIGQTPKRGGVLNAMLIENPPGFSIHESATIAGVWPVAPCYSNLVIYDPLKPVETVDTIIPELAEQWSWQDNYRNLVFFLRRNVKWHDGQPFTAKVVNYTF